MANLKEQEKWEDGVYQIEENDPVLGGENGITNKPIKQLANRTLWLKKALELFGKKSAPKDLTAESTSTADESGHSHKLPVGSTTQKGIWQATSDTGVDSDALVLTAKAGKKLAQLIATVQLALNNYIPLNKRSSAVNSNDENNVATSKAVKTAYDKGVEARIAAYAANNNANGRVSKSGDTMTGSLAITGSQSGGFANGLMLKNKAGGQNTGVFVDFYQTDNIPRASMWMSDAGNNSTQISFHNTPEGADWNRDSRQGVFTITSSGNLWSKAYGFLHDKFASKSDVYAKSRFRHQWYGNHYEGAEVFDVPMGDNGVMRTIIMGATIHGYAKLNLPESFNGTCRVQVMDVGNGRHVVGANIQNGNVVEVFNSGQTGLNIIAIGWYGW